MPYGTRQQASRVMPHDVLDRHPIIFVTDLNGVVTHWSKAAAIRLGVDHSSLIRPTLADLVDIDFAAVKSALLTSPDDVWHGLATTSIPDGRRVRLHMTAESSANSLGEREITFVGVPARDESDEREAAWELLGALAERGSEVAVVCDRELIIRYASPTLEQIFGYQPSQVLGASCWAFTHPDDEQAFREQWERALTCSGGDGLVEMRAHHLDGSWRWVRVRITNLIEHGGLQGIVLNIRDITDRKAKDAAQMDRDQLHQTILQTAREGVWAVGLDGVTLFANAKMAELLATTQEELVDRPVWEIFDRASLGIVRHHLPQSSRGASDDHELEVTTPHGECRWLHVRSSPLYDGRGTHIGNLGMYSDISRRKRLEQEFAQLALYDALTSLPNQALFVDRLRQLLHDRERTGDDVAVLFCDIDRFTDVNRVRGHEVGDRVLAAVGTRLLGIVRDGDTVARYGSDHFAVLCPSTGEHEAYELATDICAAISEPFDIGDDRVYITASIGVAATPAALPEYLVSAAESARYRAQERGRARAEVHDATTHTSADERLKLLLDLQTDLDEDRLMMHYQPVVRLSDSAPVGVEALMRWNHRSLGAISPATFIPVAEDGGLMPRLGLWSLRRACLDVMRLPQFEASSWYLAVNLSTRQLTHEGIVDDVRDTLAELSFPADRLLLEVTETAVVTDSTRTVSSLREIRGLGVRIAIDDFGTGYSSLSYLRQFPVDTIKVDRSFVAGMVRDNDDLAIVASIVSLAAAVGVQAVAEGVETAKHAEALRRLGCPFAQGFLWSAAVPADDLPATMATIARTMGRSRAPGRTGHSRRRAIPRSLAADQAVVARIIALHEAGASLTTIAAALNSENLTTADGLRWHRSSVARVIADRQFPGIRATH